MSCGCVCVCLFLNGVLFYISFALINIFTRPKESLKVKKALERGWRFFTIPHELLNGIIARISLFY